MSNSTVRLPTFLRKAGRILLRLPLFYKILIANAAIVVLGSVLGIALTAAYVRGAPERSVAGLVGPLAAIGVAVSVAVNALILRFALSPINMLERTAGCVQRGEVDARVPLSPLADRELERLTRTFNGMLDATEAYRRRLREVAVRSLNAAEEERKRIARELHDETAQTLAALLIRIRVARGHPEADRLAPLLDSMRQEIGDTLEGVRRFALGLRPPALEELGLGAALESHARTLSEAVGVDIAVDAAPIEAGLSPEAELALYRIVQEALSNVVRHADAKRVRVHVGQEGGTVVATVEDDGGGFAVAEEMRADGHGLGLFGMQERAAYLGGRVEIRSAPGRGTLVRAVVPIRYAELESEPAGGFAAEKRLI